MSKTVTVQIPDDLAEFAQAKVAAGEFASVDEAIAAGVQALRSHDALIDRWVREEVLPSYERWVAEGKPVLTEDEVDAAVEAAIVESARKAS